MTFDITETLAAKSDQLDAVDLAATGPQTYTVERVSKGSADQPVQVHLVEFPRVWRPSKGMRRVLAAGWGSDAGKWVGRQVRLFCNPDVEWAGKAVGGIQVAAMSNIGQSFSMPLMLKRGVNTTITVEPLVETAPESPSAEDWEATIRACTDVGELRTMWQVATPEFRQLIQARVKEIEDGE